MITSRKVYTEMLKTKTLDQLYEMTDYYNEVKNNLTKQEFDYLDSIDGLTDDFNLINNEIFNRITA